MNKYILFTTGNSLLDESLENYLMRGILPGGFLTAVLCNNLLLAASRADHWNRARLADIIETIVWNIPQEAWGNWEKIQDWKKDKDQIRTKYAKELHQRFIVRALAGEINETKNPDPPF